MIYTLTLNPSIDYIVSVNNFELNKTNRTATELISPGGKGINVSIMLKNLGHENTALGFVAGFTGKKIDEDLKSRGINSNFIFVDQGFSRINVKISNYDGTEINGLGPNISDNDLGKLYAQLKNLQNGDILIMSGSVPESCPQTIYQDIMQMLGDKGVIYVVDSNKDLLLNVLPYKPFLIKPNLDELSEIFNSKIQGQDQIIDYAKKLQNKGAQNILVSMGKDGAILLDQSNNIYSLKAPSGKLVNSVGAGDSMVAGFIHGCLDIQDSSLNSMQSIKDFTLPFKWAVASGSATAFSQNFASITDIKNILNF